MGIIVGRFVAVWETNNVLTKRQYGFRKTVDVRRLLYKSSRHGNSWILLGHKESISLGE